MLTYQVRKRYFKVAQGQQLTFPNTFEALFILQPLQAFGSAVGGGKTIVRGKGANLLFHANTGHFTLESNEPLRPLEVVVVEEEVRRIEFKGNEFRIIGKVKMLAELESTLASIFFGLPILLNVEMADPPVIDRVEGRVGDVPFRWELDKWHATVLTTTQEKQEKKAQDAWCRFGIMAPANNRRLAAALHYFHVFCRLCRAGQTPWEFMAEALMNLSKVLEALFPHSGDGKTIEAARAGLQKLGYSSEEIDRDYIPAMLLRNSIDCAHVHLSFLKTAQLRVLHAYTEAAEESFRKLLSKLLTQVETGKYEVKQHSESDLDSRTKKIVERLARHFGNA